MSILKTLNTPNGATAALHNAVRAEIYLDTSLIVVSVNSYASADVQPEVSPILWQWRIDLKVADLTHADIAKAVNHALVEAATSPFFGGTLTDEISSDLDLAKAARISYLKSKCQAQIYQGFDSAALGTVHHYPAGDKDQSNLIASVLESTLPETPADWTTPFWCADGESWNFAMHTAAQIQEVGTTGKASILSALTNNEQKRTAVEAATTVSEVNAIDW